MNAIAYYLGRLIGPRVALVIVAGMAILALIVAVATLLNK